MYQYKGEIERITANLGKDEVQKYVRDLYIKGFINLNEAKLLNAYNRECQGVVK